MSEEDFRVHFPEKRGLFSMYTLKRVMTVLFALVMIALFVTVGVRSCTMKGSSEMQGYLWTEGALALAGQADFQVYSIPAISQPSVNATFTISNIYYTEPLGQFQFLLSYNMSKLEEWAASQTLDQIPQSGEELFDFVLVDSEGNVYTDYQYVTDEIWVNGFYRLVFEGVSLRQSVHVGQVPGPDDQTQAVTAVVPVEGFKLYVYSKDQADLAQKSMDTLTVYEYNFYREAITVKKPDALRTDIKVGKTVLLSPLPDDTGEDAETKQED